MTLPNPLTIPSVMEPERPNGLPIAITCSPIFTFVELLRTNGINDSFFIFSICKTARSEKGSLPIILALADFSFKNVTVTLLVAVSL